MSVPDNAITYQGIQKGALAFRHPDDNILKQPHNNVGLFYIILSQGKILMLRYHSKLTKQ